MPSGQENLHALDQTSLTSLELDIVRLLSRYTSIKLAFLFGSLAKGQARFDSDLDLAVAGDAPLPGKTLTALIEDLALLTGRPVDLIDLQSVSGHILKTAVTTGRRILCLDTALHAKIIKKMLYNQTDMMPYHDRILDERREAWLRSQVGRPRGAAPTIWDCWMDGGVPPNFGRTAVRPYKEHLRVHPWGSSASSDRGREDRLSTRSPLPPNRTCGSPAYGSPVGGSPPSGLTGQG
ncbi:MAG: nucleotidyltransferase domain-containing protein, partial [Thermodesulfobacteriota bacterium]